MKRNNYSKIFCLIALNGTPGMYGTRLSSGTVALADAALRDEALLQAPTLLAQKVLGLIDEADGEAGANFGRPTVHEGPAGEQLPIVAALRKEPGRVFLWGQVEHGTGGWGCRE